MMYEKILYEGIESIGRFYSKYRGIVVGNNDPLNLNRVEVIVPQVSSGSIWAMPTGNDGALGSGFKWLTPKKGAIVWVEYLMGDPLYPLWSYHSWAKNEIPEEIKKPNSFGFITPHNIKLYGDDDLGIINIEISDDDETPLTKALISKDTISLIQNNGSDKVTITINKGKVKVESTGELSIDSKTINLNGDSEGIPKSSDIVKKYNSLVKEFNALKEAMKLEMPAIALVAKTSVASILSNCNNSSPISISDIENTKVKQ